MTVHAARAGADAALLVTPYYNKPTQEGLYRHFRAIAEAAPDLPMIPYNIQGRTAINVETETMARLAQDARTSSGVKEASGSLDQMTSVILACGPDFTVLSGDDSLTLPLMAVGGRGVISVVANFLPREVSDMTHAALGRRLEAGARSPLEALPDLPGRLHRDQPDPGEGSDGDARADPSRVAAADVPDVGRQPGEAPQGPGPGRRPEGLTRRRLP